MIPPPKRWVDRRLFDSTPRPIFAGRPAHPAARPGIMEAVASGASHSDDKGPMRNGRRPGQGKDSRYSKARVGHDRVITPVRGLNPTPYSYPRDDVRDGILSR